MEMRERIKSIRKHANMTQAEFANALGLGPYGTANWEKKDPQIPTESMQLLICKTFGVDKHWLETGEGEMLVQTNDSLLDQLVDKYSLTPMEAGIMAKFIRMDADQRAMFLDIARSLLDAGSQAQSEAVAREVVSRAVPPEPESQIG